VEVEYVSSHLFYLSPSSSLQWHPDQPSDSPDAFLSFVTYLAAAVASKSHSLDHLSASGLRRLQTSPTSLRLLREVKRIKIGSVKWSR
jgi:hypothetical protein